MTEQGNSAKHELLPYGLEAWLDRQQRSRYKLLQDERAVNWWRMALLLVILVLAGIIAMVVRPGEGSRTWILRIGVTILALEIMVGCWLFTLDTTLRFHENLNKPIEDSWALLHKQTTGFVQMVYYFGSFLGVAFLVLALWL